MQGALVSDLALVGYVAPLALLGVALMASLNLVRSVDLTFQLGRAASIGSFFLSLYLGANVFTSGPLVSPLLGMGDVGISLRLDALSIVMAWLVTFLGTLLIQFSRNYLDGDPRQKLFFSRL
jgi:NAD(P)H-quinone oxidoreductase subunit 5